MKLVRWLLVTAFFVGAFVLALRFSSANEGPVSVDLLFVRFPEVALWLALVAAFGAGAAAILLLTLYQLARLGLLARSYRRLAAKRETEIHQLRNMPLGGEASGAKALAEVEPGVAGEPGGSA